MSNATALLRKKDSERLTLEDEIQSIQNTLNEGIIGQIKFSVLETKLGVDSGLSLDNSEFLFQLQPSSETDLVPHPLKLKEESSHFLLRSTDCQVVLSFNAQKSVQISISPIEHESEAKNIDSSEGEIQVMAQVESDDSDESLQTQQQPTEKTVVETVRLSATFSPQGGIQAAEESGSFEEEVVTALGPNQESVDAKIKVKYESTASRLASKERELEGVKAELQEMAEKLKAGEKKKPSQKKKSAVPTSTKKKTTKKREDEEEFEDVDESDETPTTLSTPSSSESTPQPSFYTQLVNGSKWAASFALSTLIAIPTLSWANRHYIYFGISAAAIHYYGDFASA